MSAGRCLCSHAVADTEAMGRGLGGPRPRIADAAAALCGTPRCSCHKSIDARAHHRFNGGLMVLVLCCRRSTTVALFKPVRMLVGFWFGVPVARRALFWLAAGSSLLCQSMVRCRCMGFAMVRCQGQSGGTYELPRSVHRARNASNIAVPL
jgi:hypothetical protein